MCEQAVKVGTGTLQYRILYGTFYLYLFLYCKSRSGTQAWKFRPVLVTFVYTTSNEVKYHTVGFCTGTFFYSDIKCSVEIIFYLYFEHTRYRNAHILPLHNTYRKTHILTLHKTWTVPISSYFTSKLFIFDHLLHSFYYHGFTLHSLQGSSAFRPALKNWTVTKICTLWAKM